MKGARESLRVSKRCAAKRVWACVQEMEEDNSAESLRTIQT